jgi:transcriptional regulator of heat shock response
VLIRFGPQELYYTGLSRLFAQPEFSGAGQALNLSRLFDECEERIPRYVEQMRQADGPQCLIGAENPLGEHCTSIGVTLGGEQDWKVFTLSPIRAPYERLIPLIECLTRYSFST